MTRTFGRRGRHGARYGRGVAGGGVAAAALAVLLASSAGGDTGVVREGTGAALRWGEVQAGPRQGDVQAALRQREVPAAARQGHVRSSAPQDTVVAIPPLALPRLDPWAPAIVADPWLEFGLREAEPGEYGAVLRQAPATVAALGAGDVAALLGRLPPLPPAAEPAEAFRFPAASPPPPRSGRVVLSAFPPPDTGRAGGGPAAPARPAVPGARVLRVQRVVPAGELDAVAPHVTVTFSEAMVPLTTVTGTEASVVPVTLSPELPGRWYWLDVQTLRFQPAGRLPMGTEFVVEVPAGTRSAAGSALAGPVRAVFATPAVRALGAYPALPPGSYDERGRRLRPEPSRFSLDAGAVAESASLEPVILLVFDQRVEPAAVLRSAGLAADGVPVPLRLARAEELAADSVARLLAESVPEDRRVALRPVRPLPGSADVRLTLAPGLASAEGPRRTTVAQQLRFRTRGPLQVTGHSCGRDGVCRPGDPWVITMSNALAETVGVSAQVRVEPQLAGLTARVAGRRLELYGNARALTSYRVTLGSGVRDVHGQELGRRRTVTFDVGLGEPLVALPGAPMIVLDPEGPPRVRAQAYGQAAVRARVYRVRPEDWPAFGAMLRESREERGGEPVPPGTLVLDTVLAVPGGDGQYGEVMVDAGRALQDGLGHAIVVLAPPAGPRIRPVGARAALHATWVQATAIGLSAITDRESVLAWATSLRTGAPLQGVELELVPSGGRTLTDQDGGGRLRLPAEPAGVLVARLGRDAAVLPAEPRGGWPRGPRVEGWQAAPDDGELRWLVVSDRGLYLPGETVHLRGWLRRLAPGAVQRLELPAGVTGVDAVVLGPRGEDAGIAVSAPTAGLGGFHTTLALPSSVNLGRAGVRLAARGDGVPEAGAEHLHTLRIQEFRRPDYTVAVEAGPGPHIVGDVVPLTLRAEYFSGGGLAGAPVRWRVHTIMARHAPPGWRGWSFGDAGWPFYGAASGRSTSTQLDGETDAGGAHRAVLAVQSAPPRFPATVVANAEVRDVTRQAGSAAVTLLVHPAAVTVGLRLDRHWARPGEPVRVEAVVVDHDGRPVAGRDVELVLEPAPARGAPADAAVPGMRGETHGCRLVSGPQPVSCTLVADSAGMYRLRADVRDAEGRTSRTEVALRIAGGAGAQLRPAASLDVVADRDEYQPGDTARLLIQPPFHPAEGLLTVMQAGVLETRRFRVDSSTHELMLPLTRAHVPATRVFVELVDEARPTRFSRGSTTLSVPARGRGLQVSVLPRDSVTAPGAETVIDVVVRDADGSPVPGAEVAAWGVDEAVLALGGYELANPLERFHAYRSFHGREQENRRWVIAWPRSAGPGTLSGVLLGEDGSVLTGMVVELEDTGIRTTSAFDGSFVLRGVAPGRHVLRVRAAFGAGGSRFVEVPADGVHLGNIVVGRQGVTIAAASMNLTDVPAAVAVAPLPPGMPRVFGRSAELVRRAAAGEDVELRTEFAPLAFFEPAVVTGADGRAAVRVRLPQSLSRYRVMAVAAADADRFGRGDATLATRRDLAVRITPPRFLNHGDTVELPVLVQNLTGGTMTADVAVRAAGLTLDEAGGRRVTLPPGARAEVRFTAVAATAGSARIQAIAAAGTLVDAAAATVPVMTPATLEAFAVHGSTESDAPVVLPLARPDRVVPGYGGLDVSLTATALHGLTDAVLYLHAYPFEGPEHIASRLLAVAALREVLPAFAAEGLPPADSLVASAVRDVAALAALQLDDGGWPFWRGGSHASPFVTVHVAHALQRAREAGFPVDDAALDRAAGYLRRADDAMAAAPLAVRQAVGAYALYVRNRLADGTAVAEAVRMAGQRPDRVGGELPVEAMAWLLDVLTTGETGGPEAAAAAAELRRRLLNRAVETAGTVTFAERYADGAELVLHSRRRTDAIVLEALLAGDEDSDLAPKLAASLLGGRTAGRWAGTQENAWAVLALHRYFQRYEPAVPAFEAGVWLDDRFAGGHAFHGRTTDRQHVLVPMPQLLRADARELVIARQGEGRMYFRAGLRYAPTDVLPEPMDRGFAVSRTYEAVDDDADVRLEPDGTWRIRAGARVRVRVAVTAPSVRFHAAIVDPLPAGFEALNADLRGTGSTTADEPRGSGPAASGPAARRSLRADHRNVRDDRVEAFAAILSAGAWEFSYLARATTPGSFIAPAARAEMMYEPETFGRTAADRVIVADEGAGR